MLPHHHDSFGGGDAAIAAGSAASSRDDAGRFVQPQRRELKRIANNRPVGPAPSKTAQCFDDRGWYGELCLKLVRCAAQNQTVCRAAEFAGQSRLPIPGSPSITASLPAPPRTAGDRIRGERPVKETESRRHGDRRLTEMILTPGSVSACLLICLFSLRAVR